MESQVNLPIHDIRNTNYTTLEIQMDIQPVASSIQGQGA